MGKNLGMKILYILILIIYCFEEFQTSGFESKEIYTASAAECESDSLNNLICNLTNYNNQYIVHVTEIAANSSIKLTIIGAHKVKLKDSTTGYSEIFINDCNDVEANAVKISSYKLNLENSNASFINETVKYFKCTNSRIKSLVLRNTGEFDIERSEIGFLEAKSDSFSPTILSSNITTLELEISGNSYFRIDDSNIQMVKKIHYASDNEESICKNSSLQFIVKNAIQISNGKMQFQNTKFSAAPQSFVVKGGTLIFDNITSGLSSDSVNMEADGLFMLRTRDSKRVFTMNFKIEEVFNTVNNTENNESFFPLRKVMLKDNTLKISLTLLGLVVFLLILIITLYVIYRKYTFYKNDKSHEKVFDDLMLSNNGKNDKNMRVGSEYVRDPDIKNINYKQNEEADKDKRRVQEFYNKNDSKVPQRPIFPIANKKVDDLLNKNENEMEEGIYSDQEIHGPDAEEYGDIEYPIYSDQEIHGHDSEEYIDIEYPIGDPNDEGIYSDTDYLSEKPQNYDPNQIINSSSDKFSSDDIYSDNNYPTGKVSELKGKLDKVVLNKPPFYKSDQKQNQLNVNSGIKNKPPQILPKPNDIQNTQTVKPNVPNVPNVPKVPNVSFLSSKKDQLLNVESLKPLPQMKPNFKQNFLLNKTRPPAPPLPKVSPMHTKTPPNIPIIDEENFYEEFNPNSTT